MTNTPTPRTDGFCNGLRSNCLETTRGAVDLANFARQLEQELSQALHAASEMAREAVLLRQALEERTQKLNEARKELHDMAHRQLDIRVSALEEAAEIALSCRTQDTVEREKFYAFACSKIRNFATKLKEGTK